MGTAALTLAACAEGTGTPSPSASALPTNTSTGGPVASCLVGDWVSTEVSAKGANASGSATINGGKGVGVKIGPTGQTDVTFDGMEPVNFSASTAGIMAKGQFVYGGTAGAQIRTDDATSTSGVWEPVGAAQWGQVKITIDLSEPIAMKVLDNAPLSSYTNDQTGGAVDMNPVLGKARYTCGTGTLTLSPEAATGLTWQLTKK